MLPNKDRDEILTTLGNRIKEIRLQKGISQSRLSTDCSMEKASVSRIESGHANVTYLTLWRISRSLDVSIQELCGE